jgi:hypothetical protein
LFVSSVLFVFWYHSPNFLDTPRKMSVKNRVRVCGLDSCGSEEEHFVGCSLGSKEYEGVGLTS